MIDTIFPGLYIPTRVWPKFKSLLQNVTGLNCSMPEHILGQDYEHCFVNRTCAEVNNLEDIYLYFNATTDVPYNYTEWFLQYAKSEYASDTLFTDLNGTTHKYCKISVYGQSQDASEKRYILGNQFLKGYYIALNYSEGGHIGFNGNYYRIV